MTTLAHHRLMVLAVALSLVPRVLSTLAFRPALFTPDSFDYLLGGVHPSPGPNHPAGYPILLRFLEPFHSLLLVTSVQHLMGIAIAVVVYAVLRRWGLPSWGAVLAACPTLFDARQVALESAILPDTLYALLLALAVTIVLTRRAPEPWRCALAGLLLASAAVTRGNGALEVVGLLAALAVRRIGWRSLVAGALAFAIPVLGYMTAFDLSNGNLALTNSDGLYLWSRTMSFADCAVIRPAADLRPLCPAEQPGYRAGPTPAWSIRALQAPRTPAAYLWAPGAWWRRDAHPGINAYNNGLAMRFALDAITSQPASYLRTVASGVGQTFLPPDRAQTGRAMLFTPGPDVPRLSPTQARHLHMYAPAVGNTRPVQSYAYFLYLYQEAAYLPGVALLAAFVAGLAGLFRRRRERGGPCALPWVVAVIGLVAPVALHEAHYRYVITVVPIACLAAGLAFARSPESPDKAPEEVLTMPEQSELAIHLSTGQPSC